MKTCPHCSSHKTQSRGKKTDKSGTVKHSYQCRECFKWFATKGKSKEINAWKEEISTKFSAEVVEEYKDYKKFVISGIQNDAKVNQEFLDSLNLYCEIHKAKLILIPIRYKFSDKSSFRTDEHILSTAAALHPKLRVMGNLPINPSIEAPLSSLEGLSKGDSLIVAATTLQMRTIPTLGDAPAILHTTGAITYPITSETKQGIKSKFNHSFSALVVELRKDNDFHIRVLNGDKDNGFYDIDGYYQQDVFTKLTHVEALVMGDIHVANVSKEVVAATFTDVDSMVKMLKPKNIVFHDLLDHQSESHHGADIFNKFVNHTRGINVVEEELNETAKFLVDYVPKDCKAIIASSNHHEHLKKWLIDYPKIHNSLVNAKFYHKMMYSMLETIDVTGRSPDTFELWLTEHCDQDLPELIFPDKVKGMKIKDIEISLHGDKSSNGARGSISGFSKLPTKTITGHSHCFVDGHSALTKTGWKPIHEIQVGELVLSYDHKNNTNIWVKNLNTYIDNYTGKIVDIKTEYFQQTVTTNHNFFTKDGEYVNVCELILSDTPNKIPLSSKGVVNDVSVIEYYTDVELRKIVAFCADGYVDATAKSVGISFHLKKQRKIDRVILFFGNDLTASHLNVGKDGATHMRIIKGSQSWNFIYEKLGMVDTNTKTLPDWFRNLSIRQKEVVIEELHYWDGTYDSGTSGNQYSTAKLEEANLVSSILVELGYRTSMYKRFRNNRSNTSYECYVITWCSNRDKVDWSSKKIHKKSLERMWNTKFTQVENIRVSCLTTDVRNFWVKHDKSGQVSLTGNSPGIFSGAYVVGTSSKLQLGYNVGSPSSWANCHSIIYPNGKRQLIFIINGKWHR